MFINLPAIRLVRLICAIYPAQTMTISTAIVSEHTAKEERSAEISKLTAAMTFSFIVGPACGSFLHQRNKTFPPLVRLWTAFVHWAGACLQQTLIAVNMENQVASPWLAHDAKKRVHVSPSSAFFSCAWWLARSLAPCSC